MFPTRPQRGDFTGVPHDGERDPWDADLSRELPRVGPRRAPGMFGAVPEPEPPASIVPGAGPADDADDEPEEVQFVEVRRQLSLAIAGFSALLAIGLIVGAQSTGPDARLPYAIVIFGVQLLFVLAWTMAVQPPAPTAVGIVCAAAAGVADYAAITADEPGLAPLAYAAAGGFVVAVLGQLLSRVGWQRVKDSLGPTLMIVAGVVAYACLLVLTRQPIGAQTVLVCLAAAGVALVVARVTDAGYAKPRLAPQVPRGAAGIVLGAMLGTLAAAALGSFLVLPFDPAKGAVLGVVTAALAVLVDLAVNYSEAGRSMAGEVPTFWLARHMQGPLGAFAVAAPAGYAMATFFLS
ncbi:hypothetical protein EV385_2282 [Krasilnikovia cinnamomea]|uniref:CDP-diglyceride synthetase n=1 Tax=Krasilnikovia cinnamomea TaxID=349313 RepID=A0A4Q7ZI32_9ACTN|nr:hypothetical protein [Krasilnikovia cinnamomea]RZU50510.1 hypothetical protein EV385_2282 [Krasilnikovia cinnamomea]